MKYKAMCKLHTYTGPEREEYGVAVSDLTEHLEAEHWTGVVTLEADVP